MRAIGDSGAQSWKPPLLGDLEQVLNPIYTLASQSMEWEND